MVVKQPSPIPLLKSPVPKCKCYSSERKLVELGSADFCIHAFGYEEKTKRQSHVCKLLKSHSPQLLLLNSIGLEVSKHSCVIVSRGHIGLDGEETLRSLVPSFPSTQSVERYDPIRSLLASRHSLLSP